MAKKPCTKCGERPAAGKHAWCRQCQTETKRLSRQNKPTSRVAILEARVDSLESRVGSLEKSED